MPTMTDSSVKLQTRTGFNFWVDPVKADDANAVREFFAHVTGEDLRFRFLTAMRKVSDEQIEALTAVDHVLSENFIARDFQRSAIIASAHLVTDKTGLRAEVALAVHMDFKHKGISWTLLKFIADHAKNRGIKILTSIESRDHHQAIDLEREMGFVARPVAGDATLVELTADLS